VDKTETFQIPDHITWKNLESGVVILDLNTSNYYTLNETASDMWRAILKGYEKPKIVEEICNKYNCSTKECAGDVDEQLSFLKAEVLIEEM